MADFVNTLDVMDDEDVFRRIIEKTIAVFNDNVITNVRRNAFRNCSNLSNVNLPNVERVSLNAFDGCTNLYSIDLPNAIAIENYACRGIGCPEVNLPKAGTIGNYAFADSQVERVNFASVKDVVTNVLSGCMFLESVDLFGGVEVSADVTIAGSAFSNCSNLKTLVLRSHQYCSLMSTSAFTGTPFASNGSGGICLVPSVMMASYKQSQTNWSSLYAAGTCNFLAIELYTTDGTDKGPIDWDKVNALA